jgi:hypothetical protein
MPLRIENESMSLEIDGRVIAAAVSASTPRRTSVAREPSLSALGWLFSRNQRSRPRLLPNCWRSATATIIRWSSRTKRSCGDRSPHQDNDRRGGGPRSLDSPRPSRISTPAPAEQREARRGPAPKKAGLGGISSANPQPSTYTGLPPIQLLHRIAFSAGLSRPSVGAPREDHNCSTVPPGCDPSRIREVRRSGE